MNKRVIIVSATQKSGVDFAKSAPLGKSLRKLFPKSSETSARIFYENKKGLGTIYNRILRDKKYIDDIVLFVHDDVLIEDLFLIEKLNRAINYFDVVGIAGSLTPDKRALRWFDPWENLSGAVGHCRKGGKIDVTYYGPSPLECKLIDGLFIAVNVEKAIKLKVFFDRQFKFHFYDLDFCLSCKKDGLKIGTWPIWVVHFGKGRYDTPKWKAASKLYRKKWDGKWPN